MVYPGVAAVVTTAMTPIYAYWIAITAGQVGMWIANSTSDNKDVATGAKVMSTLYQGYSAAYRVNLCLVVGGMCLVALFWVFIVDAIRNLVSVTCFRPQYDMILDGCQMCHARRACQQRLCGADDKESDGGETSSGE